MWFSLEPQRRQWHPTPVLSPGESHGRRSLAGCNPWGRWELDMTEQRHFHFSFHASEKEMATHSGVPAWRIPGMGKPGGLLSMGSHRVGHDWSDLAAAAVLNPQLETMHAEKSVLGFFPQSIWRCMITVPSTYTISSFARKWLAWGDDTRVHLAGDFESSDFCHVSDRTPVQSGMPRTTGSPWRPIL